MSPTGIARLVGIAILTLILLVVGATATFVVPPGHRGVLVTLGSVSPGFKSEGLGFKTPMIASIVPISIRQATADMQSAVISKDLQEVRTTLKVLYRIPEQSVVQIYQQFKGDPFLSLIQPRVDEAIKDITKEHTAQEIVQKRAAIKQRTLENARRKVGDLLTLVDVVLVDISLPGASGIECVRRLKRLRPEIHILMFTVHEDSERIFQSLRAGASGYILKRSLPAEILEAIHEVASGGAPMTPAVARRVLLHFHQNSVATEELEQLTSREGEVLHHLSTGYTAKEIAANLHISFETVRNHIKSIYTKLQVNSRAEAVVKYLGR